MTTDTKLLPLPESDCQPNALRWLFPVDQRERVQDYARANVSHATAPLQAEIEALRVDVEAWKASHSMLTDTCHHFQAQAKRLAEALRVAEAALADIGDVDVAWCERRATQALPTVRAALRNQEDGK